MADDAPTPDAARATPPALPVPTRFGTLPDGRDVHAWSLASASGARVRVLSFGGILQAVELPDRDGRLADVALGYDTVDGYARDTRFLGTLVGRVANRIAGARFTLDGATHALPANDGTHHLHGGPGGFHTAVWDVTPFADARGAGLVLRHTSPDGDAGYPGTLAVEVTYALDAAGTLAVDYRATTDRATPVSLTQHAYWNLAGHDAGPIGAHELTLAAARFTPVDATLIPTGELRPVRGTPFDFTTPHAVGARIDVPDEQLALGQGYDHNFVLDRDEPGALAFAARLHDPASGRTLVIHTTEPGIQLYSGNYLAVGPIGKGGHPYARRGGLALETQGFPDAPNRPDFPSVVLRPDGEYRSRTEFRFGVA